jgi:acyl-CoA hydrolase
MPSTTAGDKDSRIVASLWEGSSVTTSRWIGCTIVTEYGCADLWGLNTRQRAAALIQIAHPKFREALAKKAAECYGQD